MSWAAAAGIGSAAGGYFGAKEAAGAQAAANRRNAALAREQARQNMAQFGLGLQERALERGIGQSAQAERRAREAELNRMRREQFMALRGENLARLDPYAQAGQQATGQMAALLGLGTPEEQAAARASFADSPGQAFLREEQERSLLRNAAALGGLGGGNVRSALQEQAFGRAQTDYQNYLAQLGALSGQGMAAARGGLEAGFGPGYMATGTDTGIADIDLGLTGYGTEDALTRRQRQIQAGLDPNAPAQNANRLPGLIAEQQAGALRRLGVNAPQAAPAIPANIDTGLLPNQPTLNIWR